jgi:hypothetical protein
MMATTAAGRTSSGVMSASASASASTATSATALPAGGAWLCNSGPNRYKKHQTDCARTGGKLPNTNLFHMKSSLTTLNQQIGTGVPRRNDYNMAIRQRTMASA